MAHVKYTGGSDTREFSASDFRTLGVEDQKKMVFPRQKAVEVDDSVAEVLLGDERLAGEFSEADEDDTPRRAKSVAPDSEEALGARDTTTGDAAGGTPNTTADSTAGATRSRSSRTRTT